MSGKPILLAAAAVWLVAGGPLAWACSDVFVACGPYAAAPASMRTADWVAYNDLNFTVGLSPPKLQYNAAALAAGLTGTRYTWRHGFAGLFLLDGAILEDGLNDAGLSAAWLWQDASPMQSNYSAEGPEVALAAQDLVPYLLGNFRTVKEVADFMDPQKLQVVSNAPGSPWIYMMQALDYPTDWFPAHLTVRDAQGDSLLEEFRPGGAWQLYPGAEVVTNEDSYEQNLFYLAAWENHTANPCWEPPFPQDADLLDPPGEFSPQERFIRLSMLLKGACQFGGEYPRGQSWSPNRTEAQETGGMPAIAVAQSLLRSVTVPWGAKGTPNGVGLGSNTEVIVLRAHKQPLYLFSSIGNPQWQGFDLSETDWAELNGAMRYVPLTKNADSWWADLTPGRGGSSSAASAPPAVQTSGAGAARLAAVASVLAATAAAALL
ncbi:hypothetical protein ABPG75_011468 [Micractinium tetrahymenae]